MFLGLRFSLVVVSLALIGMSSGTSSAQAQASQLSPQQQEAVALVEAGELAAENGRWADAVEAFESAHRISPAYTILYNLAYAHRALGRYLEARNALSELLEQYADIPDEIREVASQMRDEVGERVARIVIHGLPDGLGIGVRLNGQPVSVGMDRPVLVEVNPGEHTVVVLQSGYDDFAWATRLRDGEMRRVDVQQEPEAEAPSGSSVLTSAWFWTITGLVVAGGGVGLGLWLHDRAQLVPSQSEPMMVISID